MGSWNQLTLPTLAMFDIFRLFSMLHQSLSDAVEATDIGVPIDIVQITRRPLSASHSFAVWSVLPEASSLPSGLKAMTRRRRDVQPTKTLPTEATSRKRDRAAFVGRSQRLAIRAENDAAHRLAVAGKEVTQPGVARSRP